MKFSDVFEFKNKSGIKAGEGLEQGRYFFYTSSDEQTKFLNEYLFDSDALIFGTGGNASVHFTDKKFAVSTDCLVAQPIDKKKAHAKFYYYFLRGSMRILERGFKGAGLKHISKSYISAIELPKEDFDRQKTIVEILDQADALRQKRKQSLQLLEDFLRATFIDMFGDPLLNPKQFKMIILEEAFTRHKAGTKCGPFGSALKKHEYVDQGMPVWTMYNIGDNCFIPDGCLFITEKKYCDLEGYSVELGDIIISRAGTVGKMCVVDKLAERSIISTNLIRLSLDKDILEPQFFTFLMTQFPGRVGRLKTGADGAYTFMNTGILSGLELSYPPVELQRQFLHVRDIVKNIQITEDRQLLDMDNQFNVLIQQYFEN